jgi:hypothetical protein
MHALRIYEPFLIHLGHVFGEDGRILRDQRLKVPWRRSRTSTSGIEVLGNYLVAQTLVVPEFAPHFVVTELTGCLGFGRPFNYELETLVQLVFNLFAVLQVFRWIVAEEVELGLGVFKSPVSILKVLHARSMDEGRTSEVRTVFSSPPLCETGCNPYRTSNPVIQFLDFGLHIRYDLDTTASSTKHSDFLPFKQEPLLVRRRMHQLPLEIMQARNVWPLPLIQHTACIDKELGTII